ncbi:MAG: IPT/TIG domain-containing protein [Elusimicrobiota bacterium]
MPAVTVSGTGVTSINGSTNVSSKLSLTTQLLIDTALSFPSARDVKVKNPDGTLGQGLGLLTLLEPLSISTCTPHVIGKGAENTSIRVYGKGFAEGIRGRSDSAGAVVGNVNYIGANEMIVPVSIDDIYSGGTAQITLINTNGDSAQFTLDVQEIPVITSITPDFAPQGAGGLASTMTVVINGYKLGDVDVSTGVSFGNGIIVSTLTAVSQNSLTLGIRVQSFATVGMRNITIIDKNGKKGIEYDAFEVTAKPSITSITPASLTAGTTVTVDVRGTGFNDNAKLSMSGSGFNVFGYNYYNNERFLAKVYASTLTIPGTYDITVTNPDQSKGEGYGLFTLNEPPKQPEILEIVPGEMVQGLVDQELWVLGHNFENGIVVSFGGGGIQKSSMVYVNENQLRLIVTVDAAALEGSRLVRVINPSGKTDAKESFTIISLPKVTKVVPNTLTQGTTTTVYVQGTGFTTGADVTISGAQGITVSNIEITGAAELHFSAYVSPQALVGAHDVTVITPNGTGQGPGLLNITAPLNISSVYPSTFAQGAENRDVWIRGTGFREDSQIVIGNNEIEIINTAYLNQNEMRVTINVPGTANIGDKEIAVYNNTGAKDTSDGLFFVIPPVEVTAVYPEEIGIGVQNKRIRIDGKEFKDGAAVKIVGLGVTVSSVTFSSTNQIFANVSVNTDVLEGYRDVVVTNLDGNYGKGESVINIKEQVTVSMLSPEYFVLTPGTTYQNLIVRGANFEGAPSISFSGQGVSIAPGSVNLISSDELTATVWVDTMNVTNSSIRDIYVTNSDGAIGKGGSLFRIIKPISVSRVVPSALGLGSENAHIKINGEGFIESSDVTFNDSKITVSDVQYISAEQLDVTLSIEMNAYLGKATFTITGFGAPIVNNTAFTVTDAPVIHSVEPAKYARGAKLQTLKIQGTGFDIHSTTVSIPSGITIHSLNVNVLETEITLVISVESWAEIGKRDVTVVAGNNGKFGTAEDIFEIVAGPSISDIYPEAIIQGKTKQDIVINGAGFSEGLSVKIDAVGVTTNTITFAGENKLIVNVDVLQKTSNPGKYDIIITNPDGSQGKGIEIFEVKEPPIPPTLVSISPERANKGTTASLVLTGSNFQKGMVLSFPGGGISITTSSWKSVTQVDATIEVLDTALIGPRNIILSNPDGGVLTYNNAFEVTTVPIVTSITPSSIERRANVTREMYVNGTGFIEGANVKISGYGVFVSSVVYMGTTELLAYIVITDTAPIGTRDISVINPYDIRGLGEGLLNVVAPAGISKLSPSKLTLGESNRIISIFGSGFNSPVNVKFEGGIIVNNIAFFDDTRIDVDVTVPNTVSTGWKSVTVTNIDQGVETKKSGALEIGNPVEVIQLDPSSIGRGALNKEIVVTGSNFSDSNNSVTVDAVGVVVTTYTTNGTTSITMKVNVSETAPLGTLDVQVTNSEGSKGVGKGVLEIVDKVKINSIDPAYIEKSWENLTELSHDHSDLFSIYMNAGDNSNARVFISSTVMKIAAYGGTNLGTHTITLGDYTIEGLIIEIKQYNTGAGAGQNGWEVTYNEAVYQQFKDYSATALTPLYWKEAYQSFDAETAGIDYNYIYGKEVIIRGEGFSLEGSPSVTVSGSGITTQNTSVESDGYMKTNFKIDADNIGVGAHDITIRNADGTIGKGYGVLQFLEPLYISTCAPSVIGNTEGTGTEVVRIIGKGFIENMGVTLKAGTGLAINNIKYIDSTEIQVTVTPSEIGNKTLEIKNPETERTKDVILRVEALPIVTGVSPSSLPQSAGGASSTTITLYGKGFDVSTSSAASKIIKFSDNRITVSSITYLSAGRDQMNINVRVDRAAAIGSVNIEITDKDNNIGTSREVFSITPSPSVVSITPASLRPGTTVSMDIRGTGFASDSRILFSGVGISTTSYKFASSERILVGVIADAEKIIPDVYDITVQNGDLSSGIGYGILTVLEPPLTPIVIGISPDKVAVKQTNQDVIISGANFEQGAIVNFIGGGVNITTTTLLSKTELRLKIDIDEAAQLGYRGINVTNPSGRVSETVPNIFQVTAMPEIISMSPASLVRGTTNWVTIAGNGFSEEAQLEVTADNYITISSLTVVGATQIRFKASIGSNAVIGQHDIMVWTNNGSGIGKGVFKVVDPVSILNVTPPSVARDNKAHSMSITGESFDEETQIEVTGNGVTVGNIKFVSSQEMSFYLTLATDADETYRDIIITNKEGSSATQTNAVNVVEPVVISGIEPASLGIGASSQTVIINGTGFSLINGSTPTVTIAGVGVTLSPQVSYNSSRQLVVTAHVSPTASVGARTITAANADGNEGEGAGLLSVEEKISIQAVEPASKAISTTTFSLKIIGSGFDTQGDTPTISLSGRGVSVVSRYAPTSGSEMHIDLLIDTNTVTVGSRDITITNPDGTTGIGKGVFTITEPLTIIKTVPTDLGKGAVQKTISVYGRGFVEGAQITFDGSNGINLIGSPKYISAEQIDLTVSLDNPAVYVGFSTMTVTNPNMDSYTTNRVFKVTDAPVVNAISQGAAFGQGAANQTVVITGANYVVGNTTVTFAGLGGGVIVRNTQVNASSNTITLTIDVSNNATIGKRDIIVTSGGIFGTGKALFEVLSKPIIQTVTPSGHLVGTTNQTITLTGLGFGSGGGTSVSFNPNYITVNSVSLINSQTVKLNVSLNGPSIEVGNYDIIVTNNDNSTAAKEDAFAVLPSLPTPIVYSISPSKVHQGLSGQEIAVIGGNFEQGAIVSFSGGKVIGSSVAYISESQLQLVVAVESDAVVGFRDVTITNPNSGTYTLEDGFEVVTTPTITSSDPSSISKPVSGGENHTLLINGTGFSENASVRISGQSIYVSSTRFVGSTQLETSIVVYSSASVGAHDIIVDNTFGISGLGAGALKITEPLTIDNTTALQIPRGVKDRIITVKGTGFENGASVVFGGGGITVNSVDRLSSKELELSVSVADNAELGARLITITNTNGTSRTSETGILEIVEPILVSSCEPSQIGKGLTNKILVVHGSGFEDGAIVSISGSGITLEQGPATFVSAGELHSTITVVGMTNIVLGPRDVVVTNPSGEKGVGSGVLEVVNAITIDTIEPKYMVRGTSGTVSIRGQGFDLINGSTPTVTITGGGVIINQSSVTYVSSVELTAHFDVKSDAAVGARDLTITNADGTIGKGIGVFQVTVDLTITNVLPESLGQGAQNEWVEIRGRGFTEDAAIDFGSDITVQEINYVSSEKLLAKISIDTGASGAYNLTVRNPHDVDTKSSALTITNVPVVLNVSPQSYSQGAKNQTLIIDGYNIAGSSAVRFNDGNIIVSTPTVYTSSMVVTVTVPQGTEAGKKDIIITDNTGRLGISRGVFEITPKPTVIKTDPAVVDQGTKDVPLTVYGTGFKPGISVSFNNTDLKIVGQAVYISPERVTVSVDASSSTAGTYDVIVTNSDQSKGAGYGILSVVKPPVITKCSPAQLSQGTQEQNIVISGSDFMKGLTVNFIGGSGVFISSTSVVSSNQVIVKVSVNDDAAVGARTVQIVNPNNSATGLSGVNKFEVTPKPIINSLVPATLMQGATSWITIKGTGFYVGSEPSVIIPTVTFSGGGIIISSTAYVGSTEIKVYVEVADTAVSGNRDVRVVNADGTAAIGEGKLTIVAPMQITSLYPAVVAYGDTDKIITIKGQGFNENAAVVFSAGDITVSNVTYVSDNEMSVTISVPSDSEEGPRDITITNQNGVSITAVNLFSIIAPITINGVNPSVIGRGVVNKTVLISGSNFQDGAVVSISGAGVTLSTVSYSNTEIGIAVSVAENAPLSKRDITITNPNGLKKVQKELLEVVSDVTISKLTPGYVMQGSSLWIDIAGTGFGGVTASTPSIKLSGTGLYISSITYAGSTSLRMYIIVASTANVGARDITIRNADGTIGVGQGSLIVTEQMQITAVEPAAIGRGAENQEIVITGIGFIDTPSIVFSKAGISASGVTFIGSNKIKVNVSVLASAATGYTDITIKNPNNVSKTASGLLGINLAPVITGLSISELPQGAEEQTIIISGYNMQVNTNTAVEFSGTDISVKSTNVTAATSMAVVVSVNKGASLGARDIIITNANGEIGVGRAIFNITKGPQIISIAPTSLDQGVHNQEVNIYGSGFKAGAVFSVDALKVTISETRFVSSDRLIAVVSIDSGTPTGQYNASIRNLDGSNTTGVNLFTVTPPPSIAIVTPTKINRGVTNFDITIIGNNFADGAVVSIDGAGISVNKVTFVSSVKLIVNITVSESATVGSRTITVVNTNGSIGIGANMLEIASVPSLLSNVKATNTLIDYEKGGVPDGVTVQYTLSAPVDQLKLDVYKGSGENVRSIILYDVPLGAHTTDYVFFWDGSIIVNQATGQRGKINGEYLLIVSATSGNEIVSVQLANRIEVEVVNIYNQQIEYTKIGSNQDEIGPYKIKFDLSKAAFTTLNVLNSSGTVVRDLGMQLGKSGANAFSWDGRDSSGKNVARDVYTIRIDAYDESIPTDRAYSKYVKVSVDQLKVVDVQISTLKAINSPAKIQFIPAETMNITVTIYEPGTEIKNGVPVTPGKVVKTMTTYLEKGTTFYTEWDGKDSKGNTLIDGDYVLVITGVDSFGSSISEPIVRSISVLRAGDINARKQMFEENSYVYPNPVRTAVNSSVKIRYSLNRAAGLRLQIFDIMGDVIYQASKDSLSVAESEFIWDVKNDSGRDVARGLYIYVLEAKEYESGEVLRVSKKIMVIR